MKSTRTHWVEGSVPVPIKLCYATPLRYSKYNYEPNTVPIGWVEGSVPTALYYSALLRYMNPTRTHWVEGSIPTFAVFQLHSGVAAPAQRTELEDN